MIWFPVDLGGRHPAPSRMMNAGVTMCEPGLAHARRKRSATIGRRALLALARSERSQRLDRYETSPHSRPGVNRELTGGETHRVSGSCLAPAVALSGPVWFARHGCAFRGDPHSRGRAERSRMDDWRVGAVVPGIGAAVAGGAEVGGGPADDGPVEGLIATGEPPAGSGWVGQVASTFSTAWCSAGVTHRWYRIFTATWIAT